MARETAELSVRQAAVARPGSPLWAFVLVAVLAGCAADPSRPFWQDVRRADILEGYEVFLGEYPKSGFADEAKERMKALRWRDALAANTVARYRTFIERYPKDKLSAEARGRAGVLDWPRVERLKSVRVFRDYLRDYPDSVHAAAARTRIAALAKAQSQGLVKDGERVAAKIVGQRGVDSAPLEPPPGQDGAGGVRPAITAAPPMAAGANRPVFRAAGLYINRLPHHFYRSARGRYAIRGAGRDIHYLHVELEIRPRAAFDFEISVRDRRGRRLQRYDQTLFEDGGLIFPRNRAPGFSAYPFHTPGIVYYKVDPVVRVTEAGGGFVRSLWRLPRNALAGATLHVAGRTIPLRPFAEPARRGWVALPLDPVPGMPRGVSATGTARN